MWYQTSVYDYRVTTNYVIDDINHCRSKSWLIGQTRSIPRDNAAAAAASAAADDDGCKDDDCYGNYHDDTDKWRWSLQWRNNGHNGFSNHQPYECLLSRLLGHRSKKTSKFRVTGLCEGNSPGIGEFPAPRASNAENSSIWWRHHVMNTSLSQWLTLPMPRFSRRGWVLNSIHFTAYITMSEVRALDVRMITSEIYMYVSRTLDKLTLDWPSSGA